jgi:hypothetical protein
MRWRTGKKLTVFGKPEPGAMGSHKPESATRRKKTMLTIGPAASAFGTKVLIPIPMAVKATIPTTMANTSAAVFAGPVTPIQGGCSMAEDGHGGSRLIGIRRAFQDSDLVPIAGESAGQCQSSDTCTADEHAHRPLRSLHTL